MEVREKPAFRDVGIFGPHLFLSKLNKPRISAILFRMTNQTLCELMLLLLLAISCARVIFTRPAQMDPLATVPLVTFVFSILNVLAFGLSVTSGVVMLLAFFVTIWNVRALLRFSANLVVDHYGVLFTLVSLLNLLLAAACIVLLVLYRPVKIDREKKYAVKMETTEYTGGFDQGFVEYEKPFEPKTLFVRHYYSTDAAFVSSSSAAAKTVVFIPGECSTLDYYEPFFVKLAHDGFNVYAGEFFGKEAGWFDSILDFKPLRRAALSRVKNNDAERYAEVVKNKSAHFARQYEALLLVLNLDPDGLIAVVGDGLQNDAYGKISNTESSGVDVFFDFSQVRQYKTPGYGPIDATCPLLAKLLGFERDGTFYMASHLANSVEIVMNNAGAKKTASEED